MKDSTALSPMAHTITSFYHHANPLSKDAHWYLVDQAKHPDALRRLFEHDPAPVYDLPYIYSGYRKQAFDGPLIIKPVDDDCKTWLNDWTTTGKALALHSPQLALGSW
ncbi:MAG TPA: hypothetical protein ENH62_03135 [Marinobacter sp.]|uniref:Uncharacterized protein n=2 Tax=root TaxID=1 RepID=A0A831R363_9GAMM|nr:hypothetical protein [Marinobacter antarcticus]HDZ37274.1 hypothetical protein [Marinobacter sp.]HEA53257.1 hypothetical protein [Marinobacter antarcticus]